jgi:hypothetical protein
MSKNALSNIENIYVFFHIRCALRRRKTRFLTKVSAETFRTGKSGDSYE